MSNNNHYQIPLPIPEDDDIISTIAKAQIIPSCYSHIIGTPINRFKSHAKSARK